MKLLFDENLSARLVALFQAIAALVRVRAEDLKRFEANPEEALLVIESI